jgi:hypothetical protein
MSTKLASVERAQSAANTIGRFNNLPLSEQHERGLANADYIVAEVYALANIMQGAVGLPADEFEKIKAQAMERAWHHLLAPQTFPLTRKLIEQYVRVVKSRGDSWDHISESIWGGDIVRQFRAEGGDHKHWTCSMVREALGA